MRVEYSRPPMFEVIDAKFHIANKPVLFAWGDTIYNPMKVDIPAHLMAHEVCHGMSQLKQGTVEEWWQHYIDNAAFRLAEEILAHKVEYRTLFQLSVNRHERRTALKITAQRLASPLYGKLISTKRAERVVQEKESND